MPKLFGLDIAAIVNREIAAAGGVLDGKLTKVTSGSRTSGSLTAGTNPAETTHSFKGFMGNIAESRFAGQLQTTGGEILSILGASLPAGVEPEVNDRATLDGAKYELVKLLRRDPAAAMYEFEVEGG